MVEKISNARTMISLLRHLSKAPDRVRCRLRNRKNYVCVVENGKRFLKKVQGKRPYPKNRRCELCGRHSSKMKIDYHHWNKKDYSKGMWICSVCHIFVTKLESGLVEKYVKLKAKLDKR